MRLIDADVAMERMKIAYEDMGVDTHGIWNKQLAEIFKAEETDLDDIRLCLCSILGAVAQAPTVDRPLTCSECKHWHEKDGLTYCDRIDYGYGYKADDFCSRGERKDDE